MFFIRQSPTVVAQIAVLKSASPNTSTEVVENDNSFVGVDINNVQTFQTLYYEVNSISTLTSSIMIHATVTLHRI